MTFVAVDDRRCCDGLRAHLTPAGRAVVGFGAGRGYPFDEFLADAAAAGLQADLLLSTRGDPAARSPRTPTSWSRCCGRP